LVLVAVIMAVNVVVMVVTESSKSNYNGPFDIQTKWPNILQVVLDDCDPATGGGCQLEEDSD
jgi:hypothetical protein